MKRPLLLASGAVIVAIAALALVLRSASVTSPAPLTKTASATTAVAPSLSVQTLSPRPVGSARGALDSSSAPSAPGPLARFAWGSGAGKLGRTQPDEANPEGPMTVAAAPSGALLVVDQVNDRLVRVGADGRIGADVRVPVHAAQDVAVAPDGTMVVLDRLVDKTLVVLGADGRKVGELPLEGAGIPEGGAVTGVFVDGRDVYVEREHGMLVRVGDTSGRAAAERTEIPGRPSRDGKLLLTAGITDKSAGRVYVSAIERAAGTGAPEGHRFTRELRTGAPVWSLMLLDTDRAGTIYLGVEVDLGGSAAILLACLDPQSGRVIGSVQLPASTAPEETFRPMTVLDEGGVVYARQGDDGVTLERYSCGR